MTVKDAAEALSIIAKYGPELPVLYSGSRYGICVGGSGTIIGKMTKEDHERLIYLGWDLDEDGDFEADF